MLKRAKTVTSVCCFTKRTPRLRPEWLKMLGTNLTRPKTGQKNHWVGQKTNLTELTQGRNILSLIKNILSREYSLTSNGIFWFCQENILSLLDDVADDVAMWPSVDDVDADSAPTCRMTWLSSQARIPALTGFSGSFLAKLRWALQGSFQLRFQRSLYRRTRIDERNLHSWSKSRSENFENSATLNRELKNVFFSVF